MKLFIAILALALLSAVGASAQTLPETVEWMHAFAHTHSAWETPTGEHFDLNADEVTFKGCQTTQLLFVNGKSTGGVTYSLSDLDPTTISTDSLQDGHIGFETTNLREVISWVDKDGRREWGGATLAQWAINFDSDENANRFVKAFKHAVILCGGKASAF